MKAIETAPFYMFPTFVITYAPNTLNMPESPVLTAITVGTLVSVVVIPIAGKLADRVGTKKVFVGGRVAVIMKN